MVAEPARGREVAAAVRVMLDPVGARSGTRSHAPRRDAATNKATRENARRKPVIMMTLNILEPMHLRGQSERGYAMAALLVSMAVMAIVMTAAMPVWRQITQREKEEELIFRGKQYARA